MYIKRYKLFQVFNFYLAFIALTLLLTFYYADEKNILYIELPYFPAHFMPKFYPTQYVIFADTNKINKKYWRLISGKQMWDIFEEAVNHSVVKQIEQLSFFILDNYSEKMKKYVFLRQHVIYDYIIKNYDTILFKKLLSKPNHYYFNIYDTAETYNFLYELYRRRDLSANRIFLNIIIKDKFFKKDPKDFFLEAYIADDTTSYFLLPDSLKFKFLKIYDLSSYLFYQPKTLRLLALIKALKENKLDSILSNETYPDDYKFALLTIYGLPDKINFFENKVKEYYEIGDNDLLKVCFFGVISNPEPNKYYINKEFGKNTFKPIYTYKVLLKYLEKDDMYFLDNNLTKIALICCYSFYDTLLLNKIIPVINESLENFYDATPIIWTIKTYPFYRTSFSEKDRLSPRDKKIIFLIKNGANIFIQDYYKHDALYYAENRKYFFAYYLLITLVQKDESD